MQAIPPSAGIIVDEPTGANPERHATSASATGSSSWRVFTQVPDMINGDSRAFSFIFVGNGLEAAYHYPKDAVFTNIPEIASDATLALRIVAEATLYYFRLATVYTDAAKRAAASVILATARVSSRRAWGFRDADMVDSQMWDTGIILGADGGVAADVPAIATSDEWDAAFAIIEEEYRDQKNTFAPKVIQMGIDMPACNGVTLVVTGVHHYVDPNKAICDTAYAQHIGEEVHLPGGLSEVEVKDLICHKASHVVKSPILTYLGRSQKVKEKLTAIGHGAAAVRIPAEFAPEKAASAMYNLVTKAAQAAVRANVVIDTSLALNLKTSVSAIVSADPTVTGMAAATKAVDDFKESSGADVAWCGGFMAALFEGTSAPRRSKSVLESYAVKGLLADNYQAYSEGFEHYGLYLKWSRAMVKEGHLNGHSLFGAEKPEAFMNPAAEMDAKLAATYGSGN